MKPLKLVMQAFGPFATREVIDFTRLGENPLFLINGVTGSGKSSILDAICFALYGQTTDAAREGSSMRCDYAAGDLLTELIFDFSLGDYQYRIRRTPKQQQPKKRGEGTIEKAPEAQLRRAPIASAEANVFEGENSELLVPKKSTEASAHINTITGLSVDQFRQVMVLPQGKFRELLLAESKDREAIFSQLFQTHIYKKIEDKLKEQSAEIRREREQLKNKELGLLDSAEFTHRSELLLEQEQLLPQLDEQRLAVANIVEQYGVCQQALDQAKKVQLRLSEQASLRQDQTKLQSQSQQVQAWRDSLHKHKGAAAIKPLLVQYQKVDKHYQQSQAQLLTEQKTLSALELELTQGRSALLDAEKNAELIPSLQRQQQELQRLEQQVEKLQQAQIYTAQGEKDQLAAQQALDSLQAKVDEHKQRLIESDATIAKQRLQLQELSGVRQQLEQLKNAGISLKNLQELKAQQQHNAAEQQKYQALVGDKADEFKRQTTVMLECELKWHRGQAALLAKTLNTGEPCPVCGSCEHPSLASDQANIDIVDKSRVEAERAKTQLRNDELKLLEQQLYGLQQQAPTIEAHINSLSQELGAQAEFSLEHMRSHYAQCNDRYQSLLALEKTVQLQETNVLSLRQELDQLLNSVELARHTLSEVSQQQAANLQQQQGLESEVDERYRVTGVLSAELSALENNISQLQADYQQANSIFTRLNQQHAAGQATVATLEKDIERQAVEVAEVSSAWHNALLNSEFVDECEYQKALLDESSRQDLELRIQQYQQRSDQLQGRLSQLQQDLGGQESVDIEPLQAAFDETQGKKKQLEVTLAAIEGRNKQLQELERKLEASRQESEQLDERYAVLGTLSDIAAGQNSKKISLQRFVLSVLLDDVLVQASQRLQLMSQGRYQLIRKEERAKGNKASGLELEVEDAYTGKARPVATLSGGESFMAALSMALGLSDVVQAYSGGIKLDTLFIDEGFGSLDQESLELALRTLINLQASGRTIGIISHVTELKEQMAQRIDVVASREGSRVSVSTA